MWPGRFERVEAAQVAPNEVTAQLRLGVDAGLD